MDSSRSPRQNAPAVAAVLQAPATLSNSSRTGPDPKRRRATVSDPAFAARQRSPARRGMFSTISRSTSAQPWPVNSHNTQAKYTINGAGSDRVRSSRAPASSTTGSTNSGVKVRVSNPNHTRSG